MLLFAIWDGSFFVLASPILMSTTALSDIRVFNQHSDRVPVKAIITSESHLGISIITTA